MTYKYWLLKRFNKTKLRTVYRRLGRERRSNQRLQQQKAEQHGAIKRSQPDIQWRPTNALESSTIS